MKKHLLLFISFCCISFVFNISLLAQVNPVEKDTVPVEKKKNLAEKLLGSIMQTPEPDQPVKIVTPFLKYNGRIIRSINIFPLAFNQNIDDTTILKDNLAIRVANRVHVNTRISVIRNLLFFHEGEKFIPLLVSDNESFLRNQTFLQDALILVQDPGNSKDSLDIIILVRDVFSIGASLNANSSRVRTEVREENLLGTGSKLTVSGIYDMDRKPQLGSGAEFEWRNIRGTYLNWATGYSTFRPAFNIGLNDENVLYTQLVKPLVNRYNKWTGSVEFSRNRSVNAYMPDSLYHSDFQYNYINFDIWAAYNIGSKVKKEKDSDKRLRHFIAGRAFYRYFDNVPMKYDQLYYYAYANINGVLFSYNIYRQNFYRSNFIYAFGRNENVPTGISASLIAGWANKDNRRLPYYGINFEGNRYSKKGRFNTFIIRLGGYYGKGSWQDIALLANIDHFSRLRKMAAKWRNRNFMSFSFARQFSYKLNDPLFLSSEFGLPYFQNGLIESDERATLKFEAVFYNLRKVLGFRFAPFLFSDYCVLKPVNLPLSKVDGFSALGTGFRMRNENLVFGTIEVKGYLFPRTNDGMQNWKIDLTSKIRFKFNSDFIRKPDFIMAN